jgi:predicted phage terminase large subunit-like protein
MLESLKAQIQDLPPHEQQKILLNIHKMPERERNELFSVISEIEKREKRNAAQGGFLDFIKAVYPNYLVGAHHKRLANLLEEAIHGDKKRIIVNIAPRMGKSEMVSYLFPAWFLGHHPDKKIIMSTHTADLSVSFGRRVRDLVHSDDYKAVFPEVSLNPDAKAAGQWSTRHGGQYYAVGVGGALAGRGADVFVIDDPHSEQEAKTNNPSAFLPAWDWFQSGPLQRLMPNGVIIVVMCMTGDTKVLLADGTEKRLDSIKVGDIVATYEYNKLTTSKVINYKSNGIDNVYTIRTQSGIMLQANERHPFLVDYMGGHQWIQLKNLRPGMSLVATTDAIAQQGHKKHLKLVPHASPRPRTIRKTLMRLITLLGTTASTEEKHVYTPGAQVQLKAVDIAQHTTTQLGGPREYEQDRMHQRRDGINGLNTGMELRKKISTECSRAKAEPALYANNHRQAPIQWRTGVANYALTTTTQQIVSGLCSVIAVIWQWGTQKHQKQPMLLQDTSDFTTDMIVEIVPSGRKEVYDVQIERTENFIANGVVSHNTRWSMLDLTGQLTNHMIKNPDADQWEVVEFPAILNENELNERSLWPEFWPLEELKKKRAGMDVRYWSSQYMQNPTSEGAQMLKREWWNHWEEEEPPSCDYTIMSLDAAQESHNRADFSAMTLWGVFYKNSPTTGLPVANIILLHAWQERMEFPELKKRMLEEYHDWEPDTLIVEKKSAGAQIIQEFRSMGIPVMDFTPSKGNDKISRANAVSDIFASGLVWAPKDRRWAQEVITQCAEFPVGANDDLVDSTTQAMLRFRKGGFITLPNDWEDELPGFKSRRQHGYF